MGKWMMGQEWIDDSDALDYALTPRKNYFNECKVVKWKKEFKTIGDY